MAKRKTSESLTAAFSSELKSNFDLAKFKEKKMLNSSVNFKEQKWIPFTKPLQKALSIPGIPMGHITIVRGGSDTGKTTLLIETAIEAQKMGILPIFIITEMKWDFSHAQKMGLDIEAINSTENGDIIKYDGFFLYIDRSSLNTIEDVSEFIADMFHEQKIGNIPYDLLFLWDSSGSIPCRMSIEKNSNNPQWNAGAMASQFGNFINQKFPLSRKESSPYTNTFLVINKTGVQPADSPMGQPRMTNKGGNTMYWDASLVITFGNVTNSGTSKIKAVKDKKNVEFAKRTKVAIDKIHLNDGVATKSTVVVTPHGFIEDIDSAINNYKKQYSHEWFSDPEGNIEIVEDKSEWNENSIISLIDSSED
jgi:hypothetical protein